MVQQTKLIVTFVVSSIFAFNLGDSTLSVRNIVLDEKDDIKTICAARKCIRKCCSKDEYVSKIHHDCVGFDTNFDFTNIPVYDDNDQSVKINKTLSDIFLLVPGRFSEILEDKSFDNQTFLDNAFVLSDAGIPTYLTESGKLFMESPNSHKRWIPVDHFCIDYVYKFGNSPILKYWSVIITNNDHSRSIIFDSTALLVSSVFLFLVLVVYMILPDLRNFAGMVLMAYVFSQMGAFLLLVSMQLGMYPGETCINLSAVTYFFFLASFCWMNVMSFDICWTFRGKAKARPINRRGEIIKFALYCLFAWGLPLLMAIALVMINNADLKHMPWFIKPQIVQNGCFLTGGEKLLYLYVPMLILIVCNWVFLLMTVLTVWRTSRRYATRSEDADGATAYRKKRSRLRDYFKLAIITGISWVFEVVSFFTPELQVIWNVTDAYNLLLGVAIFFIFVCNKKIYRKLQHRFYVCFNLNPRLNESLSNSSEQLNVNEMKSRTNSS